ncbi:SRP72 RNA-binding domain-containing protein [Wolffia australiana]
MPPKGKTKPLPPAAAAPAAVPVEELFSTLQRHVKAMEFEKVAKVADQVLAASPGDEDALRCKIVALIKADSIDRALLCINTEAAKGSTADFGFYKAYCLYRQNKLNEALEALQSMEKTAIILQLEAQILYRLGRMEACVEIYEKLRKLKIDSLDMKTNMIAALISAGRSPDVEKTMDALKIKPSSSFELAYNSACSLIEKKQYSDAERMLLSARRIGQETLMEDDILDDEMESELAPITVQLAYVQQLQGQTDEALQAYSDVVARKLADASSVAVATNNLIALKGGKDVSDGLRKLDQLVKKDGAKGHFEFADGLKSNLFPRQKEAVYANRVLLLLQANKLDQAQDMVTWLSSAQPESATVALLQAAVHVRAKNVQKAEEALANFAEQAGDRAGPVLLVRAQIAAVAGHARVAAESLARVPGLQHAPAAAATLAGLLDRAGDPAAAAAVLDSALAGWTSPPVAALAALVRASAWLNPEKAAGYERRLRPLRGLPAVRVEELEKRRAKGQAPVAAPPEEKKKKMKKRKRKTRFPKGFDPANPGPPPDPERWLPRRERSSYRPKKKDKRHQVRGSQGAVAPPAKEGGAGNSAPGPAAGSVAAAAAKAGRGKSRKKARS